mgnify:CR=1 FL=1
MPTSNGLSYSMNSFPATRARSGAFSRRASSISSACAPAHPAPPKIVTRCAPFSSFASAAISSSDGHRSGFGSGNVRRGRLPHGVAQGDIAREGDDRDAAARHRGLHRDLERARHLLRMRHQLAVVAALREEVLRVGLLEVSAADLVGGDLRGNGENGHTAAVAIVQPVDQVQVARAAAAGADGELAGEVRLGARGEGRRLLVPHVDPSELVLSPDGVGDPVERVSRDP